MKKAKKNIVYDKMKPQFLSFGQDNKINGLPWSNKPFTHTSGAAAQQYGNPSPNMPGSYLPPKWFK